MEGSRERSPGQDTWDLQGEIAQARDVCRSRIHGQTALVTGCSAGIGLQVTLQLLAEGVHVFGVARRQERIQKICEASRDAGFPGTFTPMAFDVRSADFTADLAAVGALRADILVCNAGLARGRAEVTESDLEDWHEMMDTNFRATTELVRQVVPLMKERGRGHIVGLGSIAGHMTYEGGSVYCASKFALRAFFQCLRQEICGSGVRVSLVSPGLVETEFSRVRFRGDVEQASRVYAGVSALTGADVAAQVLHILRQPRHVNIDDMILMPEQQASAHKIVRR